MSAPTSVSIDRFLTDPAYLGKDFGGPTWLNWRVLLKGALAENLTPSEHTLFRSLTDRDPPTRRVRHLWAAVGRRGGKDRITAALLTYLAVFGGFNKYLARGETASILCLAVDRDQSRIVHSYAKAFFTDIPLLKFLLVSADADSIKLTNNCEIVIATNSFSAIRGRTIAAAVLDEISFWRDLESKNPAEEVFNALRPGMVTMLPAGAMTIAISTTHRAAGLFYDRVTRSLGKDDPNNLAVLAPSTTFNPMLLAPEAQEMINSALEEDHERASAEYLSIWRSDLVDMFDRQTILAATDNDVTVRFPKSNVAYTCAGDASGGRNDSFAAAWGHVDQDLIVVDRLYERRAPFDPDQAMDEVSDIALDYHTASIHHDDYGGELISAAFRKRGLVSRPVAIKVGADLHKLNRSEIYLNALGPFAAGRVRLPYNARLIHQLISLERRPVAGGHDRVDHPRGSGHHDDLAVAVCALIVMLAGKTPMRFTQEHVAMAAAHRPGTFSPQSSTQPPNHATMSSREKLDHDFSYDKVFGPRPDAPPERRHALYIPQRALFRARGGSY